MMLQQQQHQQQLQQQHCIAAQMHPPAEKTRQHRESWVEVSLGEGGRDGLGGMAQEHGALIVHPAFRHTLVHQRQSQQTGSKPSLDILPIALLHAIAGRLDAQELLRFEQTSKRMHHAANDDRFWLNLLLARFGWRPQEEPPSWRALYRFQHELFVKVILRRATDTLMHMRMGGLPSGFGGPGGFIPIIHV